MTVPGGGDRLYSILISRWLCKCYREAGLPVDGSGRVYVVGSVAVLHPEAQTVDEMLEGWRNQQLCR